MQRFDNPLLLVKVATALLSAMSAMSSNSTPQLDDILAELYHERIACCSSASGTLIARVKVADDEIDALISSVSSEQRWLDIKAQFAGLALAASPSSLPARHGKVAATLEAVRRRIFNAAKGQALSTASKGDLTALRDVCVAGCACALSWENEAASDQPRPTTNSLSGLTAPAYPDWNASSAAAVPPSWSKLATAFTNYACTFAAVLARNVDDAESDASDGDGDGARPSGAVAIRCRSCAAPCQMRWPMLFPAMALASDPTRYNKLVTCTGIANLFKQSCCSSTTVVDAVFAALNLVFPGADSRSGTESAVVASAASSSASAASSSHNDFSWSDDAVVQAMVVLKAAADEKPLLSWIDFENHACVRETLLRVASRGFQILSHVPSSAHQAIAASLAPWCAIAIALCALLQSGKFSASSNTELVVQMLSTVGSCLDAGSATSTAAAAAASSRPVLGSSSSSVSSLNEDMDVERDGGGGAGGGGPAGSSAGDADVQIFDSADTISFGNLDASSSPEVATPAAMADAVSSPRQISIRSTACALVYASLQRHSSPSELDPVVSRAVFEFCTTHGGKLLAVKSCAQVLELDTSALDAWPSHLLPDLPLASMLRASTFQDFPGSALVRLGAVVAQFAADAASAFGAGKTRGPELLSSSSAAAATAPASSPSSYVTSGAGLAIARVLMSNLDQLLRLQESSAAAKASSSPPNDGDVGHASSDAPTSAASAKKRARPSTKAKASKQSATAAGDTQSSEQLSAHSTAQVMRVPAAITAKIISFLAAALAAVVTRDDTSHVDVSPFRRLLSEPGMAAALAGATDSLLGRDTDDAAIHLAPPMSRLCAALHALCDAAKHPASSSSSASSSASVHLRTDVLAELLGAFEGQLGFMLTSGVLPVATAASGAARPGDATPLTLTFRSRALMLHRAGGASTPTHTSAAVGHVTTIIDGHTDAVTANEASADTASSIAAVRTTPARGAPPAHAMSPDGRLGAGSQHLHQTDSGRARHSPKQFTPGKSPRSSSRTSPSASSALRSRNRIVDRWLHEERAAGRGEASGRHGRDRYADLDDFIVE